MRKVVLFDLDQTIIPWDTQLIFRSYVLQKKPYRRILGLIFPFFLPFAKVLGAGGLKRVFHCYLWRMTREELENLAQSFVNEWLDQLVYPEIVEEVRKYREAGHLLILSSASPELWVSPLGQALGFDHSFGTLFEWKNPVPFFPDLIGENHKSEEKVKRLRAHDITDAVAGYTDSKADLPLLDLCEQQFLVNPLPRFRELGEKKEWVILEPVRPTKSRFAFALACVRQYWGFWKP